MPLLSRFKKLLSWRPRILLDRADRIPSKRIHLLPGGMELLNIETGERFWQLNWTDVKEIVAYKWDLFGYDLICIGFRTADEHAYWEVAEEDYNWNTLCDFLRSEFKLNPRWWSHVAYPAFVTNWTTIWGTPWPLPCPNCNYDLRGSPKICPECGREVDPPSLLPPSND